MSLVKLMNWMGCGSTDGKKHKVAPTNFKGLPYVGTLPNGNMVYSRTPVDTERTTDERIVFRNGDYVSDKNSQVKGHVEMRTPGGGEISLRRGGSIINSDIDIS